MIKSFDGEHRWLSNFWPCTIKWNDNLTFTSVEAAYQASKCKNNDDIKQFCNMSALEAKRAGRKVKMREDFDERKQIYMENFLRIKFAKGSELGNRLKSLKDVELVEGNYWHDNYWGSCTCDRCGNKGQNNLGKLLMKLCQELNQEESNA